MAEASCDRLSSTLMLDEPVSRVRQVSAQRATALAALGIKTVRELVFHFPRRYVDLSQVETIASASIGQACTLAGVIHRVQLKAPKPRLQLVEISIVDDTSVLIVTAFRQPWLARSLHEGMRVAIAGTVEFSFGYKRMTNPVIQVLDESDVASGMIISVHPACEKVSATLMRRLIRNALDDVSGLIDPMPVDLRMKYRLMSRQNALRAIHFPNSMDEALAARRRLAFEQLLVVELMLMRESMQRSLKGTAVAHVIDGPHLQAFAEALPFELTEDQQEALASILSHLGSPRVANHLVLGDVGTGKTILAGFAIAAAADTGTQALFMAPTELLARQHAQSMGPLFDRAGIMWEVLCGSTDATEREAILARLAAGTIDVLIGTHALLEDSVVARSCSLVIIDEQQRFGVDQRECLLAKGEAPDALYLTATPIPRTLALALYGDLTLSYLRMRPHNQASRTTKVLRRADQGIAFDAAREALARGEQVYVVCPLIGQAPSGSASSTRHSGKKRDDDIATHEEEAYEYASISIEAESDYDEGDLVAAEKEAERLQSGVFIDYKVGLLHGRMTADRKQQMMDAFRAGEIRVLVSTTVIEVGMDVEAATIMIVQDADRFGLAQLHQLRGRVGRGRLPGQMFLISASQAPSALERLSAMERTEDGFELAGYDLSLRREGDILGNRQHGATMLSLVQVTRDGAMIEAAHDVAAAMLEEDPQLSSPEHAALARELRLMFKDAHVRQGG